MASGGGTHRRRVAVSFFYLVRTLGKAGLMLPIRTFPVSPAAAGPRTGGNAGLMLPIRTFPLSLVLAGTRTGEKAGLMLPIRTFPLSETPHLSEMTVSTS
jgi:hypothetical protein